MMETAQYVSAQVLFLSLSTRRLQKDSQFIVDR